MKSLLLGLLLAAAPVAASAPDLQLFQARAEGSLTIGANGEVLEVELSSAGNLGKGVLEGFEQRIRAWRFEPITEGGQPVNAKGRMSLALVAAREKGGDTATFGIRHVQFLDPPGAPVAGPRAVSLAPPIYPGMAIKSGAGAEVVLYLKLDADGRVAASVAERVALLGISGRQSHQSFLAKQFRSSAETASLAWQFAGFEPGATVRVPVLYTAPQWGAGWVRTVTQPVELPEWAQLEQARTAAIDFNAGGMALSTQLKLLTPLDGA